MLNSFAPSLFPKLFGHNSRMPTTGAGKAKLWGHSKLIGHVHLKR